MNGDVYRGQWVKGLKSGKGKMDFKNGAKAKGIFKNDELFSGKFVDAFLITFKSLAPETGSKLMPGSFKGGRLFGYVRRVLLIGI